MLGLGIRKKILEWLLKDVVVEEIRVRKLRVGRGTINIGSDYIDLALLTSDPALAEGRLWYRSDEDLIKYSDGSTVIKPTSVMQCIPMAIRYDYLTGTGTTEHRYGARAYVDLGVMGSAYFCVAEKTSVDNQDRTISLENLTDGVVVAQFSSNTGTAGLYAHKVPFTPPSGYKEYRVTFTNNTSARLDVQSLTVQTGTEIKDLYLVRMVEIERLGYRLKIPEVCLRRNITYGIHAHDFKELAVVQVAPEDVRAVEELKHEMDIERFRVEELREFQRRWRWNTYV